MLGGNNLYNNLVTLPLTAGEDGIELTATAYRLTTIVRKPTEPRGHSL